MSELSQAFTYQHDCISQRMQLYAGPLIREIAKVALTAAVHKQGTYALQKVLESPCSAHEYVLLGRELMKSAQELLTTEPGIYVMAKLVEQLVSSSEHSCLILGCVMHSCSGPKAQHLPVPGTGCSHAYW